MKKVLIFSLYAIMSFGLFFILTLMASRIFAFTGFYFKFLLSVPSYYLLTLVILKRDKHVNSSLLIFGALLVPFLALYLFIVDIEKTIISLPGTIAQLLGIILAFTQHYLFPKVNRWGMAIGITLFSVVGAYYFYPRFIHHLKFQNTTGDLVNYPVIEGTIDGIDQHYDSIQIDPRDTEYLVLDAWNSSCKGCFIEFTDLEELKDIYEPESIQFYSIYYPLARDSLEKVNQYVTDNWDLNYVYVKDTAYFRALHLLHVFPSYYIVNQKSEMIFRGNLTNLKGKLSTLLPANTG